MSGRGDFVFVARLWSVIASTKSSLTYYRLREYGDIAYSGGEIITWDFQRPALMIESDNKGYLIAAYY